MKLRTSTESREGCFKHSARAFLALIVLGLITAYMGRIYQYREEAKDRELFSPRGTLFPLRDAQTGQEYRLHLYCTGNHELQAPTVVLISGGGDNSIIWDLVQFPVSKAYRVCSYDRAGYGWSDPGPWPRSVHQNTNEIHTLLSEAGIEPPYVLVGHSLGGLTARRYAQQFTDQVAGVVMVDSTNADELADLAPLMRNLGLRIPLVETSICEIAASVGLYRFLTELNVLPPDELVSKLPTELRPEARALRLRAELCRTLYSEQVAVIDDVIQLHSDGNLGELPMIILSPWQSEAERANITAQQGYWSMLSSQVEVVMVENSGHYVHLDQPDAVVTAILEMARKVQK